MAELVGFLIVIFVAALSAQEPSCSKADGFLTTDFAPSTNDVVHFFNLTEYFNSTMEGSWDGPLNFTLLESDNQTVVVNLECDTGFYDDWCLGANGAMYIPFFGDYEYEPNSTYERLSASKLITTQALMKAILEDHHCLLLTMKKAIM
jgi:hypothetical protein